MTIKNIFVIYHLFSILLIKYLSIINGTCTFRWFSNEYYIIEIIDADGFIIFLYNILHELVSFAFLYNTHSTSTPSSTG